MYIFIDRQIDTHLYIYVYIYIYIYIYMMKERKIDLNTIIQIDGRKSE